MELCGPLYTMSCAVLNSAPTRNPTSAFAAIIAKSIKGGVGPSSATYATSGAPPGPA